MASAKPRSPVQSPPILSTGSTNAADDSFTALGGLALLVNLLLGEVVFGGLGLGLAGLIMTAVIAVFLGGLMIGRTPEYLGKKIGPSENKMIVLYALTAPATILSLTAIAIVTRAGLAGLATNGGPTVSPRLSSALLHHSAITDRHSRA